MEGVQLQYFDIIFIEELVERAAFGEVLDYLTDEKLFAHICSF